MNMIEAVKTLSLNDFEIRSGLDGFVLKDGGFQESPPSYIVSLLPGDSS